MKTANILFLILLVLSFVPQIGVIYIFLSSFKWVKSKQLFLDSAIVWIVWTLSTILTGIFLGVTESTTSYPTVKSIVTLHTLRILVLVFINTGVIAGILFFLMRYRKTGEFLTNIWRKSFILSIATSLTLYILIFISFFTLEYIFGTF